MNYNWLYGSCFMILGFIMGAACSHFVSLEWETPSAGQYTKVSSVEDTKGFKARVSLACDYSQAYYTSETEKRTIDSTSTKASLFDSVSIEVITKLASEQTLEYALSKLGLYNGSSKDIKGLIKNIISAAKTPLEEEHVSNIYIYPSHSFAPLSVETREFKTENLKKVFIHFENISNFGQIKKSIYMKLYKAESNELVDFKLIPVALEGHDYIWLEYQWDVAQYVVEIYSDKELHPIAKTSFFVY